MKEGTRNFLVGTFVISSLAALGILMVWFGETPEWLRTSEWTVEIRGVTDLRGIGDGTPVNLNGVEIGRVTGLDFVDRARPEQGVVVIARIDRDYSIPRGSLAKIYGATLGLGSGHVNIIVEKGGDPTPVPKDGTARLHGQMASMLGEVVTKDMIDSVQRTVENIGSFAAAAEPVAANLETMLEQRRVADLKKHGGDQQANVTTVVERIDNFVANLNAILGDVNVQDDVKGVVRDLKDTTLDLKEMITMWRSESQKLADNTNNAIDRTEEKLEESFAYLNTFLKSVDEASRSLATVMHAIEQGKGTAGLIAKDERLYEAAVLAIQRLDKVLGNIERITGKIEEDGYITVGQITPVGTFTEDFPVGAQASDQP